MGDVLLRALHVVEALSLPTWAGGVQILPKHDRCGVPALSIIVVVRSGDDAAFPPGGELNALSLAIHDALLGAGIDEWPFVDFISADDLDEAS